MNVEESLIFFIAQRKVISTMWRISKIFRHAVFLRDNNYNLLVSTISNLVTLVLLSVNLHFVWLSRIFDLAINNLLTSVHTVLELPRAADAIVELSPEDEERLREGLFLYSITLTQSF